MSEKRTANDFLAERPVVDLIVPAVAAILWFVLGWQIPEDAAPRAAAYTALSAASGIVLAAATFACSMMYHSNARYVVLVREEYPVELRRNWRSILIWLLATTLIPIASIVVDGQLPVMAFVASGLSGLMILVKFLRIIYWFDVTLSMEEASRHSPERRNINFEIPPENPGDQP
jgi:hypothetical protein